MTITAKVVADSMSLAGNRITTMELTYPRFIHAEFMTHRVFSRNASSSRAIPVARAIQNILDDTAMPIHWGKNQPGMQAREEHDERVEILAPFDNSGIVPWCAGDFTNGGTLYPEEATAPGAWLCARDFAIRQALAFSKAGYHKQIVNRLLEPFAHITVVVTATEWANFFELRDHEDAQPEIAVLARAMKAAMAASTPRLLQANDWHTPYVDEPERHRIVAHPSLSGMEDVMELFCRASVARCARVSYLTHDGQVPDLDQDLSLFNRLAASRPKHLSPTEHQAKPIASVFERNFFGWSQFRNKAEQL